MIESHRQASPGLPISWGEGIDTVLINPCGTYGETKVLHTTFEQLSYSESMESAMASAQIESDQNPTPPTSAEIYQMCMESDKADQYSRFICKAAGVAFPPEAA